MWPKIFSLQSTTENQSLSYWQLFRFASVLDVWLTAFSVVSAITTGICLPVLIIIFGKLAESFVRAESTGCSNIHIKKCFTTIVSNFTLPGDQLLSNELLKHANLMEYVITYCIESAAVGMISLALHVTFITCLNIAAKNQACRMKSSFFKAFLRQELHWHDAQPSHDFVSQSTDNIRKIEESIGERLGLVFYYSSAFIACTVTAFYHGWELTMIILTPLPLLTATTYFLSKQQTKFILQEFDAKSVAMANAKEVLQSVRTVVAFSGQSKEVESFRQNMQPIEYACFRRSLTSGLESGLWWLLTFISYALAFWYGVSMVLFPSSINSSETKQKYDVSTFNIVFFNVLYAGTKINQLLTLVETFSSGKVAATSVFETIDQYPTIQIMNQTSEHAQPETVKGQVEFHRVYFSYPSRPEVPVLKDISFNIPAGKMVALVGPSGCGKTTCIQLIQRFYNPSNGQISLDGIPLNDYDPTWLRSHIGIVGQEPVLFAMTIRENILLGNHRQQDNIHINEIKEAARQANAHQFIESLPLGYETLIGDGGTQLSGGQKQCIAIARALIGNPKILLLDEPTSALDAKSECIVKKALDSACQGRTCFVIAHKMATIRKADLIIVLRNGTIAEAGSHDTLVAKEGLYHRLVAASNLTENVRSNSEFTRLVRRRSSLDSSNSNIGQPDGLGTVQDEESPQESLKPIRKKSTTWFNLFKLNRQLLPCITLGFLGSIVTGLTQPVFAILFGETLSVLTMAKQTKSEIDAVKNYYLIIFLAIALIAGLGAFMQTFTFSLAGNKLSSQLGVLSYQSILSQEISWFDQPENNVGSLCTRLITDPSNVQAAVSLRSGSVIQGLASLVFSLALAFYYQWKLALVGSIFVPILLLTAVIDSKIGMTQNSASEKKCCEDSNRVAMESISNIRTVIGLNKQNYFHQVYTGILETGQKTTIRKSIIRGLVCGLASNLDTFASIAFMYYGGLLVQKEAIPFETIFTVSEALIYGMEYVGKSFALMPNFSKANCSARRICSLLSPDFIFKTKKSTTTFNRDNIATGSTTAQIRFKNIQFSYPVRPDVPVLEGFEVLIEPGQTVALVGPSGSGKSTCIQLLERFYNPDKGSIHFNGCYLTDLDTESLRFQFGLVGQEPVLFNRTIAENIAYGDNTRQEVAMAELIDCARQANIHHWIQSLPLGYETIVGHRGTQLSGGQKQRVAIARALIRQPRILILDEATSALDAESELMVQQALNRARVGRTCIVISHRLRSIQNADHILVLNQGRVQEQGSHEQLMEIGGLYFQLVMSERGD